MPDQVARGNRRRFEAIEYRAGRRAHMHGTKGPLVVWHVGTHRRLDRERGVGVGVVQYHVDAARTLRRGTREIDVQVFILDGDCYLDANRLVVAVAPRLVLIATVGQRAYGLAHGAFRARDDLAGQRVYRIQSELVHKVQQFARTDGV